MHALCVHVRACAVRVGVLRSMCVSVRVLSCVYAYTCVRVRCLSVYF